MRRASRWHCSELLFLHGISHIVRLWNKLRWSNLMPTWLNNLADRKDSSARTQQCTVDHPGLLWFAERRSVSKGLLQQCLHHFSRSFFPLLGTSEKCHTNPTVTTAEIVKIGAGQLKRDLWSLHGRVFCFRPAQCDQAAQSHGGATYAQSAQSHDVSCMSPSAQPLEQCLKLLEDCRILGILHKGCHKECHKECHKNVNYVINLGPNKWSNVVKYMQPCHFSKRSRALKASDQ